MSKVEYQSVARENQGSFNNPRQKTWLVQRKGAYGWQIELITNSFREAKEKAKEILSNGGQFTNIDRVIVSEIAPINVVLVP